MNFPDTFDPVSFPDLVIEEAEPVIDLICYEALPHYPKAQNSLASLINDLSNITLCDNIYNATDWVHRETEKAQAADEKLEKAEQVDLLCRRLFVECRYIQSSSYPETASYIRQVVAQITGFHDPEEAASAFPQSKFLAKIVKVLRFPELAEARSEVKRQAALLEKEGFSGTYLLRARGGGYVGVFKPEIEACGAAANPKGHVRINSDDLSYGSQYNYSLREALAYEFNRGFANVPKTALAKLRKSPKSKKQVGSFQVFIKNSWMASKVSIEHICNAVPKREVQRLAIQDIRWLNADRHEGNLLCDVNNRLFLIDHGGIFPPTASRLVFAWINYPQSARSLGEVEKEYIARIDSDADERLLREKGFTCEDAIKRMKIAALFLKRCVVKNLRLQEIGHLMIWGPGVQYRSSSMCAIAKDSYFETEICRPILEGADAEKEIKRHIRNFRSVDWHLSFFRISPELEYSKELIDEGVELLSIKGISKDAGAQSIRVVSIAKRVLVTGQYRVEPVITTPFTNDSSMLTVSQMAEKISDAVAIINGGYFHYESSQGATYEWTGFFKRGDPVGSCFSSFVDGVKDVPKADPLWGTFAINSVGVEILKKNPYDLQPSFCEIDSGPILMKNGVVTYFDKQPKQEPVNPLKPNNPPGDFRRHINSLHPRSVVALTRESILFITVDGKRSDASGMTGNELGDFLEAYPGITDALNLDGGGSTTMWVRGRGVVNSPSDKSERRVATVLALIKQHSMPDTMSRDL